ncbi:DUF402 domain-containing protein [Oenococcus kitaharae]|uniref:Cysteinyl-tRNA synthetase related protein n=1 Tax=Oenococcus kitaharae DSM 17330 TaxID=1045004 RepID=G9WIT3_9LACO|nr:DUF402 domain-containing protein [Oenococcus kitaharae]EHN58382.1 Cysteinyl-tRNA synthetase related protein [Oenococcus kitaharae DSM 17330]MCV3296375.1 DUF402 domain-containing protein [Oenococcus kitaharae]OEY81453.1 hypothetical protein NT95_08055 [Oenococcus kitaharae]OEY82941.1 hypothetical protein NV75_06155 [Oenococcus kitaharae]OEY84515.1 hypothetical protein NT96_04480 [Oenococcus kitaharae]
MAKDAARNPREGDFITIKSYKHDGHLHRTWRDTMVLKTSENAIIGLNDHTLVTEDDGRRWVTHEPALVYFHNKYWFNIIAMMRSDGVSYYCNLASPYVMDKEALKYIDYDLDIKVLTNGTKHLLDADEYVAHSQLWHYPPEIDEILRAHTKILINMINTHAGPFSQGYVDLWYSRYKTLVKHKM